MKNHLSFNIDCPVCSHAVMLPNNTCCPECGWQFVLYTGQPVKTLLDRIQQQHVLKNQNQEQYKTLEKKERQYETMLQDIIGRHQISKEQYEKQFPNYQALTQQLEEVRQYKFPDHTKDLEQRVNQQQQQINLLSARKSTGPQRIKAPNLTFICHFNKLTNQVEVEVKEVKDRFRRVNQEIVFAVAFFQKSGNTFHEADLIIPTEAKRIEFFEKGDQINFNLKYQPPINFLKSSQQQVIHLISNSLSEYIIS